jgi:hypothetical protein
VIADQKDASPVKLQTFGGLDTFSNELGIGEQDSPYLRNVKLHPVGTLGKREGFASFGTPGTGTTPIAGLRYLDRGPGKNRVLIAAKGTALHRKIASDAEVWEACPGVTITAGASYSSAVGGFVEKIASVWVNRGACMFIANGKDVPMVERGLDAATVATVNSLTEMVYGVYGAGGSPGIPTDDTGHVDGEVTTTTETRDWTADPPAGFSIIGEGRDVRMLAFGFAEDESRVDYSELGVPSNFLLTDYVTGDISSSTDGGFWRVARDDGDIVVAAVDMFSYIVVFKRNRTFLYSGSPGDDLALAKILPVGCASPSSIVKAGNDLFWISEIGQIHALSAVQEYGDLAYNAIGLPVSGISLAPEYLHLSCAYHDYDNRRVMWFVTETGATANDTVLVVYYDQPRRWTVFDGAYAEMNAVVVARKAAGAQPRIFAGSQVGTVEEMNVGSSDGGAEIVMSYFTKWLDAGDIGEQERFLGLDLAVGSSGASDLEIGIAHDLVETYQAIDAVIRNMGSSTVGWDFARWDIDCWDATGQALRRYDGIGQGNLFKLRFTCSSITPLQLLGWRPIVIRKGRR